MSNWEPGEDPMEIHVAEAELYLDMSEDDVAESAAALGWTVGDYRAFRARKIDNYRKVNPDELTPDQYRRLFRQEPVA